MTEHKLTPNLVGQQGQTLREAFGEALVILADEFPNMVVLDADVAGGTGTHHFRKAQGDRFFQFGIAEQNMFSAAAGMAFEGLLPVVTTFCVFSQRAFEQARLSIAYPGHNVKIAASHPGLDVGPDGSSAQSLEDLSMFRTLPDMVVLSPSSPGEMFHATRAMLTHKGPAYMRTGRSAACAIAPLDNGFSIGKGVVLRDGADVALVGCGVQTPRNLEAAEICAANGIDAAVIHMPTIKPIDHALLEKMVVQCGCFVVSEDHSVFGGLGGAVAESLASHRPAPVEFVGLKNKIGQSGEPAQLAKLFGLDASALVDAARRVIKRKG